MPTGFADTISLAVERLGKRFGSRIVLEQVHFQVPRGMITALVGPNGAGKTTLLRCITGVLNPDFGRVLVEGIDPRLDPAGARARLGFLADHPALEGDLRVEEHLRLHAHLRGLARPGPRIDAVLDAVGLAHRRRDLGRHLSRGQQARLALATALLHEPPLLLLDEPSAGLDPAQVVALRHLLRGLAGRCSVLLATHHLAEAEAVCDRMVVLVDGRVRREDTPAGLAAGRPLEQAYLELAGAGA